MPKRKQSSKRITLENATRYVLRRVYKLANIIQEYDTFKLFYRSEIRRELKYAVAKYWSRASEMEKARAISIVIQKYLARFKKEKPELYAKLYNTIIVGNYEIYIYKDKRIINSVDDAIPQITKFGRSKRTGKLSYGVMIPEDGWHQNINGEKNYFASKSIWEGDIYVSLDEDTVMVKFEAVLTIYFQGDYKLKYIFGIEKRVPFSYKVARFGDFETILARLVPSAVWRAEQQGAYVEKLGDYYFVEVQRPMLFKYEQMLKDEGYELRIGEDGWIEVIWDEDAKIWLPNEYFKPVRVIGVQQRFNPKSF